MKRVYETKIRNLNFKNEKKCFFFEHAVIIIPCYIISDTVNKGYKLMMLFPTNILKKLESKFEILHFKIIEKSASSI